MTPEEIQDLEEQAAKGNPEACVKLSFYLMATDASNPDSVKRAGLLNKKAVEEFKNRLVRCIGRSTFEAADIEAESKLHLGLLYETGPVGIKRDPITAFYLIQDAFRSFRKGDAYFIRCNHFLDNMASFGYGNFCQETDEWKKLAEITDNIQNLEHEAFSLGIKIAQSVEDALINLESMLERFAAEDNSLRSEILYLRAKANYLLAAIKSDEFHSPNSFFYLEKDLSSLFNGYDLKLNIVKSKLDITDKSLDPTTLSSIAAFNKCIENLSKASDLGNGKATKELGRFYKRLAGVREKRMEVQSTNNRWLCFSELQTLKMLRRFLVSLGKMWKNICSRDRLQSPIFLIMI
jgi:hypothetical protein